MSCNQLRKRLLLETDYMILGDALVIGKQLETALKDVRKFSLAVQEPVKSPLSALNMDPVPTVAADRVSDSLDVQTVDMGPRESGPNSCNNCGSSKRATRDPSCLAQGMRCHHCNKSLNHFARYRHSPSCSLCHWCRSSSAHAGLGQPMCHSLWVQKFQS